MFSQINYWTGCFFVAHTLIINAHRPYRFPSGHLGTRLIFQFFRRFSRSTSTAITESKWLFDAMILPLWPQKWEGTLAGYYHSDRAEKNRRQCPWKLLTDEWYHRRGFSFSILIMLNRNWGFSYASNGRSIFAAFRGCKKSSYKVDFYSKKKLAEISYLTYTARFLDLFKNWSKLFKVKSKLAIR